MSSAEKTKKPVPKQAVSNFILVLLTVIDNLRPCPWKRASTDIKITAKK